MADKKNGNGGAKPPVADGWGEGEKLADPSSETAALAVDPQDYAAMKADVAKLKRIVAHLMDRHGIKEDDPRIDGAGAVEESATAVEESATAVEESAAPPVE